MPPLFRIKSLLPVLVLLFGQATSGRLAAQDTWYAAYGRAMDDIAAGRWQEAVQNLDAALQLKPGPEVNARTYGNWRPDYLPHYYLGLAWFNLGQYEKAQAEFNLSLQAGAILHAPELHEALLGYMRSVEDRLESGRQEKQNQEHVNAEITRALEFERQGDLDEARNRLETAMNLDPENETVKEHLRRVTDSIHLRDEQARQQQVDRLLNGAVRSLEKGALEAARDSAERALALAPLDARILNVLEKVEQRSRQLSAAEDDRLLAADSLLARGRRTLEQGRLTEAGRDLRRALQLDPRNRQAREYSLRVDSLIAAQARSQRQGELIREASLLLDRDSLIFARDRLIRARELGPDPLVDSLMSRVEQRLAERERLSREREAPQLVLNLPSDSTRRFTRPELTLIGTAYDKDGLQRIELALNGHVRQMFPEGGKTGRTDSSRLRCSFEESLRLDEGVNRIEITLYDRLNNSYSEQRTVDYFPPFWRSRAFLAGWLILIILSGGGYYYYRRNAMRQFLDRFRRRPFELIQPNPFIVGNPIRSKEMFFGREDDFRFVKNKVDIERYGSLIVLFGERRAGKTSVMYQILGGRLGPHYLPVFVDMQAMAVNDDWEFLGRIAELTAKAAARYKRQFDLHGFEDRSRNPFTTFERFIDSLIETIGQDKLLFLVDEYELIENKVVEGKISKDIFLFLSGLVEHKPGLFLVFAGTHLLQEREPVYWQTLLQRCDYRNISFLTPNDARRLVQEPVAGQVFYLGSSVARILRLTAGQPFYTQLVCRNVVEFLNAEQRNYFYEDDVASIVREIVDNPPPQMIYFWAGLGLEERLVLAALAEHCRNSEHYAGLNDLSVLLRKPSAPAPEAVRLVLDNLCAREILEPNLNRRFRFRMDLFRHWIREEHNLNKLLREIEHGAAVTNQNHWRVEQ